MERSPEINEIAEQCLENGEALYSCAWFPPIYQMTIDVRTIGEITEEAGWDKESREAISNLEPGEVYALGNHPLGIGGYVTRII